MDVVNIADCLIPFVKDVCKINRKILFLLLIACSLLPDSSSILAQDMEQGFVVYTDSVKKTIKKKTSVSPYKKRMSVDTLTLRSRQGKIIATYDNNWFMTEGVVHCLKQAIDTWENKIDIKKPIKFFVGVSENLDPDVAISTKVGYFFKSRFEAIADNLYQQEFFGNNKQNDTIMINALVDWNSSWPYDDAYRGNVNLTNGLLRHIAHILGFGSSVVSRIDRIGFSVPMAPSSFDNLLTDGNKLLSSLRTSSKNSAFEEFFSKPLYLRGPSFNYDIYNYGKFVSGKSGNYFALGYDNIMEYSLSDDNKLLPINQETLDVIQAIGWNTVPHDVEIICDQTDTLGYGSVYDKLTFTAHKVSSRTQLNATWYYQIYNTSDSIYTTVTASTGTTFSVIPAIMSNSLDNFNCQQARVMCRIDGKEYTYLLSLETRPLIEDVRISNFVEQGEDFYKFDLSIIQKGGTRGTIFVSDDSGAIKQYKFNGASITAGPMIKGYNLYIDVMLENDYGSASRFIQVYPNINTVLTNVNDNIKPQVTVNGMQNVDCFRDGDEVCLSMPADIINNLQIDSVKWKVCLKTSYGTDIYRHLSNDNTYSFKIKPHIFNCDFVRLTEGHGDYLWGGSAPIGMTSTNPDYCCFQCDLYSQDRIKYRAFTENFTFDVLPDCPVIHVLDTWTMEGFDDFPMSSIRIEADNFDWGAFYVVQPHSGAYFYGDTIFTRDFNLDEYVIYVREWDNTIYCWIYNSYGCSKSNNVQYVLTDIKKASGNDSSILIKDQTIYLEYNTDTDIAIYSIDGNLVDNCLKTKRYTKRLNKGLYILNIQDCKTNKKKNQKIFIR